MKTKCWKCGNSLTWKDEYTYDEYYGQCDDCKYKECLGYVDILNCSNCNAEVEYSWRCPNYIEK